MKRERVIERWLAGFVLVAGLIVVVVLLGTAAADGPPMSERVPLSFSPIHNLLPTNNVYAFGHLGVVGNIIKRNNFEVDPLCNEQDGCYPYGDGCEERDYYCMGKEAGCNYTFSNRHNDSWVDTGNMRWVDENKCKEKEQKEQEYRDYKCSAGCCHYSINDTKWIDTGICNSTCNCVSLAPPEITSFAPLLYVDDTVCNWRIFNVTINQAVNVSWYLNGTLVLTNESVLEAKCTLHAEVVGEHNVTAIASNANGSDMQTWIWAVTELPKECEGTDISCGIYPNCGNCNEKDGCYPYGDGCEERDYYCLGNEEGCNYTSSNRHNDSWVDTGNMRWVDENKCKEKEQKEQEYRDYKCSAGCCNYSINDTKWIDTGIYNTTCNCVSLAPPEITSLAPLSYVDDTVSNWRTFDVTINQVVNVSWYLNNTLVLTNESVLEAKCTLHADVVGEHNVTAIASNANGSDMQTWIWDITELQKECEATDTSCGIYPNCGNCNEKDGCYPYGDGCEERDYYCMGNEEGCNYTSSNRHNDSWVDTGNMRWVDVNECQEKKQKEQEYRDYKCSAGCCNYSINDTKWIDTGIYIVPVVNDMAVTKIDGDTICVSLKLLNIPSTLVFNQDFVPDNSLEYEWSIYIDLDNNPSTGSSYPEGCEVSISLMNFKFPGSTQHTDTIIGGTQHSTWIFNRGWQYGHTIDATVDYSTNTIKMIASKAWEELSDFEETDRFCFLTSYQYASGEVCKDITSFSDGSNIITDLEGDVPYNFIDIIQGSSNEQLEHGYAIIVAGEADWRQKSAIDHSANNAYRVLRNLGFDDDHIFYLNDESQQIDGQTVVDKPASLDNLKNSIDEIKHKIGDSPLILYLVGHGSKEVFDFYLSSAELREMLEPFQDNLMLIVIGSCYSGSFITLDQVTDSISGNNRIIITATHDDEERYSILGLGGWYHSSDRFWGNLNNGLNVKDAFIMNAWPGDRKNLWLDDNGDNIGHPPDNLGNDGTLASATTMGVAGTDDLELTSWYSVWIHSAGELRVYDSQNRVTGLVNGEVKEEIPDSIYDEQDEIVALFSPSDTYHYEVAGTDEGTYGLDIASIEEGDAITFTATNVTTSTNAAHQYTIDWDALAQGEEGVTIQIDSDGDGTFEQNITTDDTFQPPIASFTHSPAHPVVNELIAFNAIKSNDPDGTITNYGWNFGDGNTRDTTEPIITHSYASIGEYTVNLTVTDDDGATNTNTTTITVSNPPDLEITAKWLCWPGNCTICYNVTNIGTGTAPAGHNTALYVDGEEVAHDHIPVDLAPGESYTGCFNGYVWAYTPPSDNITVCADNNETLDELDETNNCLTNIWMCGDVRKDGFVTAWDVAVLNSYVAGIGELEVEQKWAGDVRTDGYITAWDVAVLNSKVAGIGAISCMCTQPDL